MTPEPFGGYVLLDRIGTGGMAEVFRAKSAGSEGFERIVAIKRMLPAVVADLEARDMLIDEARISVHLSHDNIVRTLDFGTVDSQYFIAMDYVFSRNLRAVMVDLRRRGEKMPIPAAAYVGTCVANALGYAHRRADSLGNPLHIVHRDVTPHNVLLGFGGEVKLADFGIALAEQRATRTRAGIIKGKFSYMSPEQVRGQKPDRRGDIFGLGIVLWEMLTGERLFDGDDGFSVLEKIREADVSPPSGVNSAVPAEVDAVVIKALARDPANRYQWAEEVGDALQRFLIQDTSVFSARHLAAFMNATYPEAAEAEQREAARWSGVVSRGPDSTVLVAAAAVDGRPSPSVVEPSERPTQLMDRETLPPSTTPPTAVPP